MEVNGDQELFIPTFFIICSFMFNRRRSFMYVLVGLITEFLVH